MIPDPWPFGRRLLSVSLLAATASLSVSLSTPSSAGEIIIAGHFANYTTGVEFAPWGADTSGAPAGTLVDFNSSILAPSLKTLTFTTPVYGELSDVFTHLDYAFVNSSGLFYEETNATGFLDVNIIFPGHGVSSFSFTDFAIAPPPITPIDPPPVVNAPEPSTWLMMLLGFAALGASYIRRGVRRDVTLPSAAQRIRGMS